MKKIEKMSTAILNSKLTRKEMKNVMAGSGGGGGSCCAARYTQASSGYYYKSVHCTLTRQQAISWASSGSMSGNWCCDSCGSASWL